MSCRAWLAAQMLEWARSDYPREVPADCTHASLVGFLLAAGELTKEQRLEVERALQGKRWEDGRCDQCLGALAIRGQDKACPRCDHEVVQGWADELGEAGA